MPIPAFVAALRARVGTALLWLPGASAVILDDSDRLLLVRRADTGRWALVSGIVEPGEEPAHCVTREAQEEAGVTIEVESLAYVSTTPPVTYPNGDRAQYLDLTFLCRHVGGEPVVGDDESTDVGWFPLAALPEDLIPTSRERIRNALAHRGDPGGRARFARP